MIESTAKVGKFVVAQVRECGFGRRLENAVRPKGEEIVNPVLFSSGDS